MDETDGDRAVADGGCDALDRAMPGIASGEYARHGGLKLQRNSLQWPLRDGVGSGADESPLVALDRLGQPAGKWLGADEHEQPGRRHQVGVARVPVAEQ